MARRKDRKSKIYDVKPKHIPENLAAQAINESSRAINQSGAAAKTGKFVSYQGILDYGKVAYGQDQRSSNAPLIVPPAFATQVPYNSAINSTIIQNSSAVPVTTFYVATITDPTLYQCVLFMMTSILSRIGNYVNTDKECQDVVRKTIKRVGRIKLLQSILTSIWAGFSAIKINWGDVNQYGELEAYVDEDGYTTPKSILMLPPDSILLAVTPEGLLDPMFGVMQYYYNINSQWNQNYKAFSYIGNAPFASLGAEMTPQRQVAFNQMFVSALPEEWRLFTTFNPTGIAGNHYGVSMVQPVFGSVVNKQNIMFKLQTAATYKAAPFVLFETDTNTTVQNAQGKSISKAEDLQNNIPNGSLAGYMISESLNAIKVTTIDNTAKLDEMQGVLEYLDQQIRTGMCSSNKTNNSGSYANAMANSMADDEIINNLTDHVVEGAMEFVKKVINNAIGEVDDYGKFEMIDTSLDDKAIWQKIIEGAANFPIDMKNLGDYNFCRTKIGLPEVNKVPDDILLGMGELLTGKKTTNMQKLKEDLKVPYAGGVKEVTKRTYSGS